LSINSEKWIFFKIDHFRPFFEQKWNYDQACFGDNRGVEIDRNAIKNQDFYGFVLQVL